MPQQYGHSNSVAPLQTSWRSITESMSEPATETLLDTKEDARDSVSAYSSSRSWVLMGWIEADAATDDAEVDASVGLENSVGGGRSDGLKLADED